MGDDEESSLAYLFWLRAPLLFPNKWVVDQLDYCAAQGISILCHEPISIDLPVPELVRSWIWVELDAGLNRLPGVFQRSVSIQNSSTVSNTKA
jgi:hypothetical protein